MPQRCGRPVQPSGEATSRPHSQRALRLALLQAGGWLPLCGLQPPLAEECGHQCCRPLPWLALPSAGAVWQQNAHRKLHSAGASSASHPRQLPPLVCRQQRGKAPHVACHDGQAGGHEASLNFSCHVGHWTVAEALGPREDHTGSACSAAPSGGKRPSALGLEKAGSNRDLRMEGAAQDSRLD